MPTVTASTKDTKKITLDVTVSGVPMSTMEAQQLARHIQDNCRWHLGVDEDNLTVNVTADPAPAATAETPAAHADVDCKAACDACAAACKTACDACDAACMAAAGDIAKIAVAVATCASACAAACATMSAACALGGPGCVAACQACTTACMAACDTMIAACLAAPADAAACTAACAACATACATACTTCATACAAAMTEEHAPGEAATVDMATAADIAKMSTDEFKAAKAAGRIASRVPVA